MVLLRRGLLSRLLLRRVCVAVLRLHISCIAVSSPCIRVGDLRIFHTLRGSAVALLGLWLVAAATVRHLPVHVWGCGHVTGLAAVGHGRSAVASTTSETAATTTTVAATSRTSVRSLINANLSAVEPIVYVSLRSSVRLAYWTSVGLTSGCLGVDILDIVHGRNGLLCILLLGVSHKTETAAATSVAVLHDDLIHQGLDGF